MLKVKDYDGFYRDPHSNGIIKTNIDEMHSFKANRNNNEKVQVLNDKVNHLEHKLSNVENLLQKILDKL